MTRRSPFGSPPEAIWNYTPLFPYFTSGWKDQSPLCPPMVAASITCKPGDSPSVSWIGPQVRIPLWTASLGWTANIGSPILDRQCQAADPPARPSITRDPALENLFWFHSEEEALLIKRFIFRRLQPELQLTKQSHRSPSLHYSFPKQRGRVYTLHSRICPPGISLSFLSPLFRSIRASVAIQFEL